MINISRAASQFDIATALAVASVVHRVARESAVKEGWLDAFQAWSSAMSAVSKAVGSTERAGKTTAKSWRRNSSAIHLRTSPA